METHSNLEKMRDLIDDYYLQRKRFIDQPQNFENDNHQKQLIGTIKEQCIQDITDVLMLSQRVDMITQVHKLKLENAIGFLCNDEAIGLHTAFHILSGVQKKILKLLAPIPEPSLMRNTKNIQQKKISTIFGSDTIDTHSIQNTEGPFKYPSRFVKKHRYTAHVFTPTKYQDSFESLNHTASVYATAGGKEFLEKSKNIYKNILVAFPEDPNIEEVFFALRDVRKQLRALQKVLTDVSSENKKTLPIKSTSVEKIDITQTPIDPRSGTITGLL